MEMELNTIIEKIKQEGIGEADKKAADIIKAAEEKAQTIIKDAEAKKDDVITKARQDAEKLKKNGEAALQQASRDVLLGLRESITALFDGIIKKEIAGQLSADVLKEIIVKLVEGFRKEQEVDLEVLLSEKDKSALEKDLLSALKGKMGGGVIFKVSPNIEHGFRIGKEGDNSYYDFSDEAITEAFKNYLNPKISELLK